MEIMKTNNSPDDSPLLRVDHDNFVFRMAFKAIQQRVYMIAKSKGWWDTPEAITELKQWVNRSYESGAAIFPQELFKKLCKLGEPNKGEKIALMHSELSEGLEGIRKDLRSDHIPEFSMEEEELADVVIREMDYAEHHNLRLAEAIVAKLAYNETRERKHGGKKF